MIRGFDDGLWDDYFWDYFAVNSFGSNFGTTLVSLQGDPVVLLDQGPLQVELLEN